MPSPRHAALLALFILVLASLSARVEAQESGAALSAPAPTPAAQGVLAPPPPPPLPPSPPMNARFAPGSITPLGADVSTRLRALDGSLRVLGQRGRSPVDGIMSIVSGSLSIAFGAISASDFAGYSSPPSGYFYLWGSAAIAQGILSLTLTPDATELSIRYGHLPMTTPTEVASRLQYGEDSLEYLAQRFRMLRMLDASISVATGLLVLPVYLGPNNFRVNSFLDYFVLVGASVSIISGIIGFAQRSEAERRWKAYKQLREDLEARRRQPLTGRLHFVGIQAAPLRGGAAVGVTTAF